MIKNCTIVNNGSSTTNQAGGLQLTGATILTADIIYYNNGLGTSKGRQVDSTFEVNSCAIQENDPKDITRIDTINWETSNTSADPVFVSNNIPDSDLAAIADSVWYSNVNTTIPLLLNSNTSPLLNKTYVNAPTSDIRGVSRRTLFDVGAYESASPNQ